MGLSVVLSWRHQPEKRKAVPNPRPDINYSQKTLVKRYLLSFFFKQNHSWWTWTCEMKTCGCYDGECSDQLAWRRRPSRLGDCLGWGRCSLCVESPSSSPCSQPASTCVGESTAQSKGGPAERLGQRTRAQAQTQIRCPTFLVPFPFPQQLPTESGIKVSTWM